MVYVKPNDDVDYVIEKYPQVVNFFSDKNIVCVKCGEPVWGTVEDIIKKKYDKINSIMNELNDFIEKNK